MIEGKNKDNVLEPMLQELVFHIFIPENEHIPEGYYSKRELVDLLRQYRFLPEVIEFLADMME